MTWLTSDEFDLPALEEQVRQLWADHDVPKRAAHHREGRKRWITYEGPPTVNGSPALHHVFTSSYKDVYARYHGLAGRHVVRKAGWDCQGLPIEIAVERRLGLTEKTDIERYGIKEFVQECRKLVDGNIAEFERVFERIAYWVDFDDAYRTMDDTFIESVWWHLKQIHMQGLLSEGAKVVPYCTRCGTALSSHELGQPGVYRDTSDLSAYVALPLEEFGNRALVVWTTTPWTLPANVAVAVHPEAEYGTYRVDDREYVVLVERAEAVFGESPPEPVSRFAGADLVGARYTRPFPEVDPGDGPTGIVVDWPDTAVDVGSGLLHVAPAFGEEDDRIRQQFSLAQPNPVGPDGRYTGEFDRHNGELVHDVADAIVHDLEQEGMLLRQEPYEHAYPHCWRCANRLIYWAKPTWYIRTSEVKDRMVRENRTVNWHPGHLKEGRFGNWLRDNVDWALSRDRYWGTPLPVWRCENGHDTFVGSRAELQDLTGAGVAAVSLHRPDIDEITLDCGHCGGTATRIPVVCDVWFDSGCMPAAQWGAPMYDRGEFDQSFPADFVCEAIDQTRGWFYSLMAVNTIVSGHSPYRNVVCLGHLIDDEGRKMSKSLGNVIDPVEVLPRFGADGIRWFVFAGGAPWGPRRVSFDVIAQTVRRDLDTLRNVASFYDTYARIERFEPGDGPRGAHVSDRWIISRLHRLVGSVSSAMEGYAAHLAADQISSFIDEVSNWYVRGNRRRFWGTEGPADADALATLHAVLHTLSRLMAPLTPFYAEALFQLIRRPDDPDSVHLSDWPVALDDVVDDELETQMQVARRAASLSRAVRSANRVPVRQPLREAVIATSVPLHDDLREFLGEQMNVDHVRVVGESDRLVDRQIQPNWRVLGPRFRDRMTEVKLALQNLPEQDATALAGGRPVTVSVGGQEVEFNSEAVKVVEIPRTGWESQDEDGLHVALDTTVDADLERRGRIRNLIRRIQTARRDHGLEVTDRIELWLGADARSDEQEIAREVLAVEVASLEELASDADLYRDPTAEFALRRAG
jgi:isoleucyl-tRNA synthetase